MSDDRAFTEKFPEPPSAPDPRLKVLDRIVGTWNLKHRDLNTGEEWEGQDIYQWMDGGYFLSEHHEEYGKNIKGMMVIGYEQRFGQEKPSDDIIGHWFESSTGAHYVYYWDVTETTVTCEFEEKGSEAAFRGTFSEDGRTITGAWRWPGGGYEITKAKVSA